MSDQIRQFMTPSNMNLFANMEIFLENGAAARERAQAALEILERLLARRPDSIIWRQVRVMTINVLALSLHLLAKEDPALDARALETARRAYDLATADARQNPGNWALADQAITMTTYLANRLEGNGRAIKALPLIREAGVGIRQLLETDPQNRRYRQLSLNNQVRLAQLMIALGRYGEAGPVLTAAERYGDQLARDVPNDTLIDSQRLSVLSGQIGLARKLGRLDEARERCRAALSLAAPIIKKDPALEKYLQGLPDVRQAARELGVPDPTT